ncbi:hypothetical protein EYF80_002000 [Liparis tanakae]|uniref:Uncharacterized protein n=1 Tax=Liparis tanakae TaxID=230148 RepID=A0A4Z2JD26_9TELE|nr:hypothetical protein EYF80_002000 [Liparis tanakae]
MNLRCVYLSDTLTNRSCTVSEASVWRHGAPLATPAEPQLWSTLESWPLGLASICWGLWSRLSALLQHMEGSWGAHGITQTTQIVFSLAPRFAHMISGVYWSVTVKTQSGDPRFNLNTLHTGHRQWHQQCGNRGEMKEGDNCWPRHLWEECEHLRTQADALS